MTRRAAIAVVLMMLMTGAPMLSAHEEFRVIGTLMKHQNSKIEVKNRAGKTVSIRLDKQTAISQNNKKVDPAALKAGQSLVVDSYGDTEDDSLAIEIRIVPPIRGGA